MKLFVLLFLVSLGIYSGCVGEVYAIENQKYCFTVIGLDQFVIDDSSPDGAGVKLYPRKECMQSDKLCDYISVFAEYATIENLSHGRDELVEYYLARGWYLEQEKCRNINKISWCQNILKNSKNDKVIYIYNFQSKFNKPNIIYHILAESTNNSLITEGVDKILKNWIYTDPCL